MLVGSLPFPLAELGKHGLQQMQRVLREQDPAKPSTRLAGKPATSASVAAARRMSEGALQKALKNDLDWVVLKAMAKDRNRRYQTADALSLDLQRFLDHDPLAAGPPSTAYRLRLFVRKHHGRVLAGCAVLLALVVGGIGTFVQYLRADQKAAENAKLAQDNGALAAAESAAKNAALREQGRADAKASEFEQLAGVVLYEHAVANAKELYPPWPHMVEAMETWLQEDAGRLLAMQQKIERTVRDLQGRALPPTGKQQDADRKSHPRFAEFEALTQRVASLRSAQAIRGGGPLLVPELTAEQQALGVEQLNSLAWDRVAPSHKERSVYGEEALGLAAARAAMEKANGTPLAFQILDTLAWALLANGQDAAAKQASEEASRLAPKDQASAFEQFLHDVQTASGQASGILATAEAQLMELTQVVSERRTYLFELESQRFLHDTLADLLVKIASLAAKEKADVAASLQWAKQIHELSLAHPNSKHTWAAVRAAIAQNPEYARPKIQLREHDITGLVPIGENPLTHLWEFYELRSAWNGQQDPRTIAIPSHESDGSIHVTGDTGIVFVLLPGGTFTMGAQNQDKDGPNFDPEAQFDAKPHEVTLAPFFLARHELTRSQWQRLSGTSAFYWQAGRGYEGDQIAIGPSHPADSMNWDDAHLWMTRHGLDLPTEAQWEYGCRAGTRTPYWSGREAEDLQDCDNVHDQTSVKRQPGWGTPASTTDGFTCIAPVGSYRANAFGLYDVHGNVREWCRDWYGGYDAKVRAADGGRLAGPASGRRCNRGGSYGNVPSLAGSAVRFASAPSSGTGGQGLRPARAISP